MAVPDQCPERVELPVPRRPANALNVEIGTPLPRCRLKTPSNWGDHDPRGTRWILSGGDPLVLWVCSVDCPLDHRPENDPNGSPGR